MKMSIMCCLSASEIIAGDEANEVALLLQQEFFKIK
jgi:hypothetical protein